MTTKKKTMTMTPIKSDPEGVAAERFGKVDPEEGSPSEPVPRRGPGRPKGSGKKKKTAPEPIPLTQAEIDQGARLCSFLSATLWGIAAPLMNRRDLTDDEASKLGGALFPVLNKYLPALSDWALEINLLIVVAALLQGTVIETKPVEEIGGGRLDFAPDN